MYCFARLFGGVKIDEAVRRVAQGEAVNGDIYVDAALR